jgi:hypothetical protein
MSRIDFAIPSNLASSRFSHNQRRVLWTDGAQLADGEKPTYPLRPVPESEHPLVLRIREEATTHTGRSANKPDVLRCLYSGRSGRGIQKRLAILFAISGGPHFAALLANEIVEFYGAEDNDERFEREKEKSYEDS